MQFLIGVVSGILATLIAGVIVWGSQKARKPVYIAWKSAPLQAEEGSWILLHDRVRYEADGYSVARERRLRREIRAHSRSGEECILMARPGVRSVVSLTEREG